MGRARSDKEGEKAEKNDRDRIDEPREIAAEGGTQRTNDESSDESGDESSEHAVKTEVKHK